MVRLAASVLVCALLQTVAPPAHASELFSVEVTEVGERSVKLAVRSVHPDSGPVAATATFALRLLYDPISQSDEPTTSALAEAMDDNSFLDERWILRNARAFVARVQASGETLEVWPTHTAWIGHLRKGMSWDTAAYDTGPGLAARPRVPASGGPPVRSTNPTAGFSVRPAESGDERRATLFVAKHGAGRYLAHPVVSGAEAMRAALTRLVGEPILVTPRSGRPEVGTVVKVSDDSFTLYHETSCARCQTGFRFDGVKELGRAWLKRSAPPPRRRR
jgi:hypothetical protein